MRDRAGAVLFHHPLRILVMAESPISLELVAHLRMARLEPTIVTSLGEFLNAAVRNGPDLMLIEHDLCGEHAAEVCRSLRSLGETREIPFLLFNCPGDADAKIRGLEAGADEWLDRECDHRELLLRIQATARRAARSADPRLLRYQDLEIDLERKKVRRAGVLLNLPPIQFKLLKHLIERPTFVFSREDLLDAVWNDRTLDLRTVTVGILRLRRILNANGGKDLIRTVLSTGYALDEDL